MFHQLGIKKYWNLKLDGNEVKMEHYDHQLSLLIQILCKAFILFLFDIELSIMDSSILESFDDVLTHCNLTGKAIIFRENNLKIDNYL